MLYLPKLPMSPYIYLSHNSYIVYIAFNNLSLVMIYSNRLLTKSLYNFILQFVHNESKGERQPLKESDEKALEYCGFNEGKLK